MKNKTLMKTLSALLAVVMVICSAPLSGFVGLDSLFGLFSIKASAEIYSGECDPTSSNDVKWSFNTATSVLNITGTGAIPDYTSFPPPWYGYISNIWTVNIQKGITNIGDEAFFDCERLRIVTIPDSVTSIGNSAFENCNNLTSVTIPASVTSIGDEAFSFCTSLKTITIPESVTSIGKEAFSCCYRLTSITVDPDNQIYSSDEYGVLYNKEKTTLIKYPSGNSRDDFTIPEGVTSIGDYAFSDCESLTKVTIPGGVISIGNYAFSDCKNLTTITLPKGVTSMGERVFKGCVRLATITIPESVINIGCSALFECYSLTSIMVDSNNQNYSSDDCGVLYNKNKTTLIQYPVGNSRKYFAVPEGVTSIDDHAFDSCLSLTSITIPEGVISIGNCAFDFCDSLKSIIIPESVTSIGERVFYSCDNLVSITVDSDNENYSSDDYGVLYNKDKTTLIKYPRGNIKETFEIPDSVTSIGNYAFNWCESLTTITLPDSVTSIGEWAFYGCSSLMDVYYIGEEEDWKQISINIQNKPLTNATIHYNYKPEEKIIITLADLEGNIIIEDVIDGDLTEHTFNGVSDGEYRVIVSKTNSVTREYGVDVSNGKVTCEFKLNHIGDINGDGKVNTVDVARANASARGVNALTGYDLACADINSDGKVNTVDVARMNAHAKGVNSLW